MNRAFATALGMLTALLLAFTTAALGQAPPPQPTPTVSDGRLYGHLPYADVDPASLVSAPAGFAVGQPCLVQPALIPDLTNLIAAQHAAHLGGALRGISCFRSFDHQQRVFCERRAASKACVDPAARAESVAPPGHSEHGTGYAIDFGVRPEGHCGDVQNCFAATPAGQWLILNAPAYGFELSFPKDNGQGVTWEPWHWRWVGTSNSEPGALAARALFDRARIDFPADPRIPTIVVRVISQPPLPTVEDDQGSPDD
ncbi:D-alanyl-D-alanine carboxypeptidase family protein [Sphingomonas koreensis]|nr:D-alanyl-D-alanine carboxypeptidase family protein [Sphingomonas koreensis]